MLIHFQIRGPRDWEALGSGFAAGDDPLLGAIEDLRALYGGTLPAGKYRYMEAAATEPRLERFDLGRDGRLVD